jgi:hypothetical protein
LTHPSPASALTCAGDVGTGPTPISHLNIDDSIYCINTEPRTNAAGNAITLSTINANHYIYLNNSGILTATSTAIVYGISTRTNGATSPITILNSADVTATSTIGVAFGIFAHTYNTNSPVSIENSGDFTVTAASRAVGIFERTTGANSPVNIVNSGDFVVRSTGPLCFWHLRPNTLRPQSTQHHEQRRLYDRSCELCFRHLCGAEPS